MLKNRKWLSAAGGLALVTMVAAPALSGSTFRAETGLIHALQTDDASAANAAITFVRAMREGDEATVWMFASEEEHDAFATEQATYDAYAEDFPALTRLHPLKVMRSWQEGDTPFVELALVDRAGAAYRASMGFWRDDAGDWKLVSCDVQAFSDRVASR